MHPFRKPLAAAAALLSLAACGPQEPVSETPAAAVEDARSPAQREAEAAAARTPYELDGLFAQAAGEFRVPANLLKAVAYTESRWEMVKGAVEFEGMPEAYGVMALRGEALERGARLAGVSVDAARTEPLANIRAGAALLSAYADELGVNREDLGAWAPAVVKASGITHPEAQSRYVHAEVYDVLRKGAVARTLDGKVAVSLMPVSDVQAQFAAAPVRAMVAGPDYAASIWRPSPNYNSRPTGDIGDPAYIIIHTCESGYSGCWSWLTNSSSGVSAHYVVNENGSEISQLVREANRAWHVGATYDCANNGGVECWRNGYSVNHFSVGIEHGGYASQSSFPAGQIDASAKLSCDISRDQAVPRDTYHIVGHGKLQPYNRTDPGPNWPWTDYINKIKSYCSTTGIVIDSNNNNNNTSQGYIEVIGTSWSSSSNVAGYYGSGYYAAPTAAVSEPANFWFYLPSAATKTVDAWWTSATDRSTSAPFVMFNASGTKLGTVNVNQQTNGGKWNALGTYSFSAGWNKVSLSRWTTSGYYVIADAVRIR